MEIADGIVINKADGNNVDKCELAASHFRNALHLFPKPDSGIEPQVVCYSGFYELNIDAVIDMVEDYVKKVKESGYFEERRNEQSKYWMYESINENLKNNFFFNPTIKQMLPAMEELVLNGEVTSFIAAHKLLDNYYGTLK